MYTVMLMRYGGIDWHDADTAIEYVRPDDNCFGFNDKASAESALIDHIVSIFPYEEEKIRNAFATGSSCKFPAKENIYDKNGECIGNDYEKTIYNNEVIYSSTVLLDPNTHSLIQDFCFGQIDYSTTFYITEITNPVYFVIENFLAPFKGHPSIERTYHHYFTNLDDAKKYLSELKPHDKYNTQIYIACEDENGFNKKWYEMQCAVIDKVNNDPELLYAESFHPMTDIHLKHLS